MTSLGKIFIYENNLDHIRQYMHDLEAKGFFTFGTDNLYKLLKFSEIINPDVVIMNLPPDFDADQNTWQGIENSLCQSKCPQVYINSAELLESKPAFHYFDFHSQLISEDQILDIIQKPETKNYLH